MYYLCQEFMNPCFTYICIDFYTDSEQLPSSEAKKTKTRNEIKLNGKTRK